MANQQVMEAADGAKDTVIVLNMTRQKFGGGGSGYVPAGNYAVEARVSEVLSQTGGKSGKNLHIVWETVGPEGFEGVRINTYHPIPVGDPESADYQTREANLLSLMASYYSGIGKLEEIRKQAEATLTPNGLLTMGEDGKAKRFFVLTSEEDYKGRKQAKVAFYINATEYAERSGPLKGANPKTSSGDASLGGGTPDLMGGGNGAEPASPSSSAVDKTLGLNL